MSGKPVDLGRTFRSIAKRMALDFEAIGDEVDHKGIKGHARETLLVEQYLNRYLPGTLLIRQNVEIVSSDGQRSGEVDIAICDPATPPLFNEAGVEVIPIECVHAVLEVKSHLDSAALRKAWNDIALIKRMPKTAYLPSDSAIRKGILRYGQTWEHFPTLGFVFAFRGIGLTTLVEKTIWAACHGEDDGGEGEAPPIPPEHRVDGIWVLDGGSIVWGAPGEPWSSPGPGPVHLQVLENLAASSPLPLMTMQLQGLLAGAFTPGFRIGDYMGALPFGVPRYYAPEGDPVIPDQDGS